MPERDLIGSICGSERETAAELPLAVTGGMAPPGVHCVRRSSSVVFECQRYSLTQVTAEVEGPAAPAGTQLTALATGGSILCSLTNVACLRDL